MSLVRHTFNPVPKARCPECGVEAWRGTLLHRATCSQQVSRTPVAKLQKAIAKVPAKRKRGKRA